MIVWVARLTRESVNVISRFKLISIDSIESVILFSLGLISCGIDCVFIPSPGKKLIGISFSFFIGNFCLKFALTSM